MKRLPKDQWIRVEDAFEAIVSKELFQKAQAVLEPKRSNETLRHPTELLRGLVRCESCGRLLKIYPNKKPYLYCFTGKYAPDSPYAKDLGKYSFANTLTREMLVELVDTILVYSDNTIEIVWKFADKYTQI